jgi:PAS domain S-box-containing protein
MEAICVSAGVTLADILDAPAIQAMLNALYRLTKISVGVIDLRGNVLLSTGWQDICTQFHRKQPETCQLCRESDIEFADGVEPGSFKQYRCKNGLWNISTPIFVEGEKVGNLFLSQFMLEDETPDYDVFRQVAKRYGFDEDGYIAALDRLPRWNQETVEQAVAFFLPFVNLVSTLGANNVGLEKAVAMRTAELKAINEELVAQNEEITAMNEEIASLNQNLILSQYQEQLSMSLERKRAFDAMAESEARYRAVLEQAPEAVLLIDIQTGNVIEANARFSEQFGYEPELHSKLSLFDLIVDNPDTIRSNTNRIAQYGSVPIERRSLKHRNGCIISVERSAALVSYRGRSMSMMTIRDVSEEVRREQELQRDAQLATRVQLAMLSAPEASEYLDINTVYQPVSYVGGDLFFLDWRYGGKLLRGFLVDATGHGLSTALQTASLHVLIREVNELDLSLSDAIRWLNRRVAEYFDESTLAGALGFEIDLDIRQLRWVCAGIPQIMLATQAQQGVVVCPGMCLGINEEETFEMHTISIDIADAFYFMTDGMAALLDSRSELPLARYSEMVDLLDNLSKSDQSRDDATAVGIHVRALPQSLIRQDGWPRILRFNGYGDYQRLKGEVTKIVAEVTGKPHSLQEVSIHEALANAMECRDGLQRQHKARLRFNKVGSRFIVRVKTSRLGFAGNAILRRLRSHPEDLFAFGEDASMGRGIPMMLSMSDKMTYNSEGTEVLLAWKL